MGTQSINNVQIIIPMAGKSQRFFDAGYHKPKGLIEFFAFAGDAYKGEHQAWKLFLKEHPEINYRTFFQYRNGRVAFQITVLKDNI